MNYIIGIDGGGTKTALKLSDTEGFLITENEGGACNINSMGETVVQNMLKELINSSIIKSGIKLEQVKVICIGTAGVDTDKDKLILEKIIRTTGFKNKIVVTNDSEIALYGGVGGKEGVILISGTGSICYGRNIQGESKRAGGWGHLIGDEGSGYYIGINAINRITKAYDGLEEKSVMTDLILEYLKLENAEGLLEFVYKSGAGKSEIAALAKIVDEAYKQGDSFAEEILLKSAFELFLCSKAVIDYLKLNNKEITLAVNGSVITKNKCIYSEYNRLMKKNYPLIRVAEMKKDAAWGAVILAMQELII